MKEEEEAPPVVLIGPGTNLFLQRGAINVTFAS